MKKFSVLQEDRELKMTNKNEQWYCIEDLALLTGFSVETLKKGNSPLNELNINLDVNTQLGGYHNTRKYYSEKVLRALKEYRVRNAVPNATKEKSTVVEENVSYVKQEKENLMTTKEVANILNTTKDVVLSNARKCLPQKKFEHGKPTFWNKAEITILLDYMKAHTSNNRSVEFNSTVQKLSTDLTPALKIKQAMEMMQEAYEEELQIIRARAELAEGVVHRIADGKGCFTINQTAKALKLPYGNKKLFEKLKALGFLNMDNSPRQQYVNDGTFITVVKYINEHVGNKTVTLVTSSGLIKLAKRLGVEVDFSVAPDGQEAL